MIEQEIFKRTTADFSKLKEYGFILENGVYKYSIKLTDSFLCEVTVSDNVSGKIYDLDFDEEYTNFRVSSQNGEFVNLVREKFIDVLNDIKEKCFIKKPFILEQSNRINSLILEKYGKEPIFKFESNPGFGVFENNGKWFAMIMNIDGTKIGLPKGEVEVLNIKLDKNKVCLLLKENGFYEAYHMNKKSWISIVLNDTLNDDYIMDLIDESYSYTVTIKKSLNEWVMPINPGYFDVFTYFDSTDLYYWDKKKSFREGDTVYLYLTKPIGSIMYKCFVFGFTDDFMIVKKLEKYEEGKYSLEFCKKFGLSSVRSTRHIPERLSIELKKK